jgi:glycerophosphoryl diester phosphodiesterase
LPACSSGGDNVRVQPPLIIAHRTCPFDAPENSLAGIRVAADQGADGVEVDLRLSIDGRPFLMHDNTLRRTVGPPLPVELTPSFLLRRWRLRANGEPIPTLEAAFDALAPGLLLAVDVKTPWAVRALLREVRRRGVESRVLVWCTSARAARYVVRRAPAVETAYLNDVIDPAGLRRFLDRAVAVGAGAISAHWRAIDADFVSKAHDRGLRVYSWHRGAELTVEKLGAGLDGLITDHPARARAAFG